MKPNRLCSHRHLAGSAILAAMWAVCGSAWAGPPTALSPETTTAGAGYQACLRGEFGARQGTAPRQALAEAAVACGSEEAALSAAVLKENPDRPLFARSYAQTLKDEVVAQRTPASSWGGLSTLAALKIRP